MLVGGRRVTPTAPRGRSTPSPTLRACWRASVSGSLIGHPLRLRPARDGAPRRARPTRFSSRSSRPRRRRRDRRPRPDPDAGRGRRRGPRDRRRGAPPGALNGPCGATITRDDARQEDLARRGPDAGDRRRRRDPAPPGRRDGEHEGAAHPGRGQGRAERAPVHALSRQCEERRVAGACTTRDGHRDGHDQPQARGTASRIAATAAGAHQRPLGANYTALEGIYSSGAWGNGYGAAADRLATQAGRSATRVMRLLGVASRDYAARAADAQTKVTNGSVAAIAVLLGALRCSSSGRSPHTRPPNGSPARTRACSQRARSRR